MTARDVVDGGRTYRTDFDDGPPISRRLWAIVIAHLIDVVTGRPATGPTTVTTTLAHTTARATGTGIAGILGVPREAVPRLAAQPYTFEVAFAMPGYLTQRVRVTLPAQAGFPATFAPARIGDLPLRRLPVTVGGRVVQAVGSARLPSAGAAVRVSSVWPDPIDPAVSTPASPPDVVAIRPPLLADRPTATASVRPRPLAISAPSDTRLADGAPAHATSVTIGSAPGYTVGDVVVLDADVAERREYATVGSLPTPSSASGRLSLGLNLPTALPHDPGSLVRRAVPQAAGASAALGRDGLAGDPCLFAAGLAAIATGTLLEVSGGGSGAEFHEALAYRATADGDGYYKLPPLTRLAKVAIEADDGVLTPVSRELTPSLFVTDHHLDLVLS